MLNWLGSLPTQLALFLHLRLYLPVAILADTLSKLLCTLCCQTTCKSESEGFNWFTHDLKGKNHNSLQINSGRYSELSGSLLLCTHLESVSRLTIVVLTGFLVLFVGKLRGVTSKNFGGTFVLTWSVTDRHTGGHSNHIVLTQLCAFHPWLVSTRI